MLSFGKFRTEKTCALSWFENWSLEQKREFSKILLEKEQGVSSATSLNEGDINNLLANMDKMSLQSEGPSVFDCQLKIFSRWYTNWNSQERMEFLHQLSGKDPTFVAQELHPKLYQPN